MIKEIAVEPEVMADWRHFRELWEDFGVSRGRLFSEYPLDWREKVCRRALEKSSTKAGSIMARLKPAPGQVAIRKWIPTNRSYDKGKDWLTNAEKHEPPTTFDAIIASNNPRNKSRVLVAGEFPKDQPPYKVSQQAKIPRTPEALLKCAQLLLAVSDDLLLIDPHFDASEPRFIGPLTAFLCSRDAGRPWKRCELHTERPADGTVVGNRIHAFKWKLPEAIPTGSTLNVHFWSCKAGGEKLHPRFLLTDVGGLQFDYGLDSGEGPADTTVVSLMDHDLWQTVRLDFTDPSPSFDITPDCIVAIPGRV
jgi:hypothetical protein